MEDKMLEICREVLEENWTSDGNIGCDGIVCEDCIFGDTFQDCNRRETGMFKHLAKEYIDKYVEKVAIKYEPKFKVGDIVTGVNSSQWAYGGKYKISKLSVEDEITKYGLTPMDNNANSYPGCIWIGEELELVEYDNDDSDKEVHSVNKKMFKELIAEWDSIKEDDIWESEHFIIEKDFQKDIKITYKESFDGYSAIYMNPNYIFTLQKPLTLDDFEIGEEFKVKDMDGRFMKVSLFDTVLIARKCGDALVTRTIDYLNDETLIKIKGDK